MTAEEQRLQADRDRQAYWRRWGPYLSERQWGTVREDYSPDGAAWEYFPHDHARSRAYLMTIAILTSISSMPKPRTKTFRCPISGNSRGLRLGIWRFTASPWQRSIPTLPNAN